MCWPLNQFINNHSKNINSLFALLIHGRLNDAVALTSLCSSVLSNVSNASTVYCHPQSHCAGNASSSRDLDSAQGPPWNNLPIYQFFEVVDNDV